MSVGELSRRPADAARDSRTAPVIVLAYAGSGVDQLRSLLDRFAGLTCTTGTGIVPLVHQALATWRVVDRRPGHPSSPLGIASVRTFSAGLITAIMARDGGRRWCEFSSAPPVTAQAFAHVYPQARFLIVHRRSDAVVRDLIDANRWGLSGPEFAPFVSAYPASTVAALISYWIARTTQQIEFRQAHPGSCLPIRTEDLGGDPAEVILNISEFISAAPVADPSWLTDAQDSGRPAGQVPCSERFPLDQIPAPLLERLNELHRELGYAPINPAPS
jgi:hypothetical protein